MEVTGDERRGAEDGVRRPPVPVEDPDAPAYEPGRRMHGDLAGEVANDADVVVPQDQVDGKTLAEQLREEVEDDRAENGRGADDRVFCVPGDDHSVRPVGPGELDQSLREPVRGPLWRAERPRGGAAEPEVDVRDDDRPTGGIGLGFEQERRSVGHGPDRAFHGSGYGPGAKTVLGPFDVRSPRARTMLFYI